MKSIRTSHTNTIKCLNEKRLIDVQPNQTILEAALNSDINHPHICGGHALCSSCRVRIAKGIENCMSRNEKEKYVATKLGFTPELRLACQTTIKGDISITKPELDKIDIEIASLTLLERGENKIGDEQNLSIIFADIENYTSFTESVQPYDLVNAINRYYYMMGNVIQKYSGKVIDYYGDGLLAVFGIDRNENMEFDCVTAGIAMMKEVEVFNDYLYKYLKHRFKIRIGIHTGKVIIGNIGFKGSRKLAVIGDAVNFASRIDDINKELNTNFLISHTTYKKVVNEFTIRQEYEVEVEGKTGKHLVYELNFSTHF